MMFATVVGHCSGRATTQRPTTAVDGDSSRGNHLSEPKRCSEQPGHLCSATRRMAGQRHPDGRSLRAIRMV